MVAILFFLFGIITIQVNTEVIGGYQQGSPQHTIQQQQPFTQKQNFGPPPINLPFPGNGLLFRENKNVPQQSFSAPQIQIPNQFNENQVNIVPAVKEIPVPQPYPVHIPKAVPVPVQVRVPYEVPKPYAVKVPHPVPIPYEVKVAVEVPKPYPVHIVRTVTIPVEKQVQVPVPHPVKIPVPQPYPVAVPHPVEVRVPIPVFVRVPEFVKVPVFPNQVQPLYPLHPIFHGPISTGPDVLPIGRNSEKAVAEARAKEIAEFEAIQRGKAAASSNSLGFDKVNHFLTQSNGAPLSLPNVGQAEAAARAQSIAQSEAIFRARAAANSNSLGFEKVNNFLPQSNGAPLPLPATGQAESAARAQSIAQSEAIFKARAAANSVPLSFEKVNNFLPQSHGAPLPLPAIGQAEAAARAQSIAQSEAIFRARAAANSNSLGFEKVNNFLPQSNGAPLALPSTGQAESAARAQSIAQSEAIFKARAAANSVPLSFEKVNNFLPQSHGAPLPLPAIGQAEAAARAQSIAQSEAIFKARAAANSNPLDFEKVNSFLAQSNQAPLSLPNVGQAEAAARSQSEAIFKARLAANSRPLNNIILPLPNSVPQLPPPNPELAEAEARAKAIAQSVALARAQSNGIFAPAGQALPFSNNYYNQHSNVQLGAIPPSLNIGEQKQFVKKK